MSFKLLSILFLIFGASSLFGQSTPPVIKDNTNPGTNETYKVGDVRGVNIKRRAIYLPKPPYPTEALEAGADGTVRVEVVIGADGRIVSAKAVSGHSLFYPAMEETARKTVFRRLETDDPNATETGVLVYNFAIEKENWLKIGFALAAIQKAPTLRGLPVPRIARTFQTDWTEEHEMLAKLNEMRRAEVGTETSEPATISKPVLLQRPVQTPNGTRQATIRAEMIVPVPNPPTPERIALAQTLTASLQNRLAASGGTDLWLFNTGIALAKAHELARAPGEGRNAAQILRGALDGAPADASPKILDALRSLIDIFESGRPARNTRTVIDSPMQVIFGNQ